LAGGALLLAVVVLQVGAEPFLDGVRQVNVSTLTAAICITAVTTSVSAWRWQLIARGLGLRIPLGSAVASYYRSQLLNSTLPGGVLGDVHRGVRHGAEADDISRGLRSVVLDRAAGQVVQVGVATVTLLALASSMRAPVALILGVTFAVAAALALAVLAVSRRGLSRSARVARTVRRDVRAALASTRAGSMILLASTCVVAGHLGIFLIAAAATADGAPVSISALLPPAMLVLLSMTVPVTIGGWGPREGAAAWAFAAAGLGADRGVQTATLYGVLSLVAVLPGAIVLVMSRRPRFADQS